MINDKYKNISEKAAPCTLSPDEIAEEAAAALEYAEDENNRIRGYNPNSPIVDFVPEMPKDYDVYPKERILVPSFQQVTAEEANEMREKNMKDLEEIVSKTMYPEVS